MKDLQQIEKALTLHSDYEGTPGKGNYLKKMDLLAANYTGSLSQKVSKLLDDYYNHVGVKNLDEALERLKNNKPINLTKIKHDTNGNPRYIVHFTAIDEDYQTAINKAKAIGGKKHNTKERGRCVVFKSVYNKQNLIEQINKL